MEMYENLVHDTIEIYENCVDPDATKTKNERASFVGCLLR